MDLGWWIVGWINIGTIYMLSNSLEGFIGNYGLIIILLAISIRLLMFPLSYKSYVSMAKMRVLNNTDEIKELDTKYKDDPQKLQMEKMAIYRKKGVSMFGGCLPMLLSYPFLIALFFFFPQSVELRQQSFLWAQDLSTYDSVLHLPFNIPMYGDHVSLFTILMAISTFIYTFYQQKSQPTAGANNQFKYIAFIMPIFLLVFLNSYAAGLSLYYFMSNLIQITQTTVIRLFIDDETMLAQMEGLDKEYINERKAQKDQQNAEIKELKDKYKNDLELLNEDSPEKSKSLLDKHEKGLSNLKLQHKNAFEMLKKKHKKRMEETLKNIHREEIKKLKTNEESPQKIEIVLAKHKKELEKLKKKHGTLSQSSSSKKPKSSLEKWAENAQKKQQEMKEKQKKASGTNRKNRRK